MITRFYYTLKDCLIPPYNLSEVGHISDEAYNYDYPYLSEDDQEQPYFGLWYMIDMFIKGTIGERAHVGDRETGQTDDATTIELFKHIWLNLKDKNVLYIDVEHPRWETPARPELYHWFHIGLSDGAYEYVCNPNIVRELGDTFWSLFIDTKDYYIPLISMYNSELNNLLNPITTTVANNSTTTASGNNETRFNDTPQNTLANGEYADDNFATNVTSAESGSSVQVYSGSTTQNDGMSKMARIDEIQRMLRNLYGDWAFEFNKLIVGE